MARASRHAESADESPVEIRFELGMDDDVRDRFAIKCASLQPFVPDVNGIDNTPNDALEVFTLVLADGRQTLCSRCARVWRRLRHSLGVNAIRAPNRSQEP